MFRVDLHRSARKFIKGLVQKDRDRIMDVIRGLRSNPHPPRCLKLSGYDGDSWRIRVGDYRILYEIIDAELLVWVFEVDRRHEGTYRQ